MPLMDQYPKLRGVYNDFSELKEKLYDINEKKWIIYNHQI